MDLIWGGNANPQVNSAIGSFVAERIWGTGRVFDEHTSLGVCINGRLVAGVIFHNYDPQAGLIELSAAADSRKWLTRKTLDAMYGYPFVELGLRMVVQRNSEHNEQLNNILRRFGYREYRIEQLRGPDEAELVFTLTKEQWLNSEYKRKENGF